METDTITIPPITIVWNEWTPWNELLADARTLMGVTIPNKTPGVYEVRHVDTKECLHIGKASDLRMRIRQGLVKGKVPHSSGERIRAAEDVNRLVVRWAMTDHPSAVEEELHRRYRARYGKLPRYTLRT